MNNKPSNTYLILIIAPLFFCCRGPVKEENKNNASASSFSLHVGNEKYYIIDTKETVVAWTSSSVHGQNTGYVYISKGELMIEKGQLVGGTVEVDMNTIEDKNYGSNNGLVNHLKNPDFFDVKKFPFTTIAITRVESTNNENKTVTGNLTIKGITHPVTFPARIEVESGIVKANGKLVIDRTKWDVRYGSRKFYDILANQAISDYVEFDIIIVAKK
jgi:polyisoprenoid-binding protein YceI